MNNFLHFINVLEIIDDPQNFNAFLATSNLNHINEKVPEEDEPVYLFTDIFKEMRLQNVPTPTPEGRGGFSLHMANYYKWLGQDQELNSIVTWICLSIGWFFIVSAALLGYIFLLDIV